MRFFIAVSLITIFLSITGCAKKEPVRPKEVKEPEPASAPAADTVQQKVLSFNLEGLSDKGAKKWEIKGESAEAVSESEIKLANIVAKAYGEEACATITADKGVYDKSKNNVRLQEHVKTTIENTQSFAEDYAAFPGQIAGTDKPKESNPDSQKKKTIITCDEDAVFDYEKNLAYFNKNVKVLSDDGNIDADKLTINLEPDTKKIKDIIAEGNVKIMRGENITYSEKATYIESEKKVILTGKPKLVIYQEGEMKEKFLKE